MRSCWQPGPPLSKRLAIVPQRPWSWPDVSRRAVAPARRPHDRQRHGGHLRSDPGDVRDRRLAGVRLLERRTYRRHRAGHRSRLLVGARLRPRPGEDDHSARAANRSEMRDALRHDWPLVEVTVPLVLILALG